MKTVSVFGATGSIGCTSARILANQPDTFKVEVVTGGSNAELLAKTAIELSARHAVIADETQYETLKGLLTQHDITVAAGRMALLDAAEIPVDISLQGIVGFAGVECSLRAAKTSKVLALVNKESLSMGLRISIDSASMFNKAMELVETKELFLVPVEKLEVIIQPQSIIHSMVGFCDGSIMAHMGPPDMAGAIGYALNHPERMPLPLNRLDFAALGRLDFLPVDHDQFPAIRLAEKAMHLSGLAGAVFNAAKEQALDMFLDSQIGFLDMSHVVEKSLDHFQSGENSFDFSFDDIVKIDKYTRKYAQESIKGR